jgi:hypothetical protein
VSGNGFACEIATVSECRRWDDFQATLTTLLGTLVGDSFVGILVGVDGICETCVAEAKSVLEFGRGVTCFTACRTRVMIDVDRIL